jgi:hypothetical protein
MCLPGAQISMFCRASGRGTSCQAPDGEESAEHALAVAAEPGIAGADDCLCPVRDLEFGEDGGDVVGDGLGRDRHPPGDVGVPRAGGAPARPRWGGVVARVPFDEVPCSGGSMVTSAGWGLAGPRRFIWLYERYAGYSRLTAWAAGAAAAFGCGRRAWEREGLPCQGGALGR